MIGHHQNDTLRGKKICLENDFCEISFMQKVIVYISTESLNYAQQLGCALWHYFLKRRLIV